MNAAAFDLGAPDIATSYGAIKGAMEVGDP